MGSTVSNPYGFNISKNTGFSSQKLVKASTFECEFKITACKEFEVASNEYGKTLMCGYVKDFSYPESPEYVFDLGSVNIINISNNCSLEGCWAAMNAYADSLRYDVYASIKCPNIDEKDKSISMKTYIMDSNNNIIEAETLTFDTYDSDNNIVKFWLYSDSMFQIYNTIVASQENHDRYIKLYIE